MASDTTTVLNPGVGGDSMDESSVKQADGDTSAKRARVDLGFGSDDARGRLVGPRDPLPVEERGTALLEQIADDIHAIRELLTAALNE